MCRPQGDRKNPNTASWHLRQAGLASETEQGARGKVGKSVISQGDPGRVATPNLQNSFKGPGKLFLCSSRPARAAKAVVSAASCLPGVFIDLSPQKTLEKKR